MAIDLWSGNSSPRISFSHDLHNNDDIDNDNDIESSSKESNYPNLGIDYNDQFDFCITDNGKHESIAADEIFSNGVILPLQLQERFVTRVTLNSRSLSSSRSEILKEDNVGFEQKNQTKSFWGGIKRSSSVHCDNSYKKSSFWSLPLLKRSSSTGSAKDQRQQKRNLKEPRNSSLRANANANLNSFYAYSSMSQKPPLKKNYGNVGKISPLINVGSGNLFGLGSFFGNGKDKKNKK